MKTKIEEIERIIPVGFQTHKLLGKPRSVLGEVYINGLLMHANSAHYGMWRKKCFI